MSAHDDHRDNSPGTMPLDGPGGPSAAHPPAHDHTPSKPRRSPSTRTKIIGAATLLAVGLGGGLVGFGGLGGSSSQYQTVSDVGANPFMSPVGTDQTGMTPVAGAGGERAGDTSGLYAQDPEAPACDVTQLVANLEADPAKAAAWAAVFEIAPEKIPQFTASLTPVVLRSDTAVIDHGYQDGAYVSTPAVLATGTAVFINAYGEPTVKCYSGDPLTRGESSEIAGTTSTVITPAPTVVATNTFVNPTTGRPVVVPGKPDTSGRGPNPTPGPTGPVTPPPAPLTGTFNHDGTVTLSDGRIMNPDGSFKEIKKVNHPAGSKILPDGGIQHPDGKIFNRDGTERKSITLESGVVIKPDGTVVDKDGKPVPFPPGLRIRHNYDGTLTFALEGPGAVVVVIGLGGKPGPLVKGTLNPDGSVTTKDGKIVNPDGSERKATTLPDGGTIEPDGTNVPASPGGGKGKKPEQNLTSRQAGDDDEAADTAGDDGTTAGTAGDEGEAAGSSGAGTGEGTAGATAGATAGGEGTSGGTAHGEGQTDDAAGKAGGTGGTGGTGSTGGKAGGTGGKAGGDGQTGSQDAVPGGAVSKK